MTFSTIPAILLKRFKLKVCFSKAKKIAQKVISKKMMTVMTRGEQL